MGQPATATVATATATAATATAATLAAQQQHATWVQIKKKQHKSESGKSQTKIKAFLMAGGNCCLSFICTYASVCVSVGDFVCHSTRFLWPNSILAKCVCVAARYPLSC